MIFRPSIFSRTTVQAYIRIIFTFLAAFNFCAFIFLAKIMKIKLSRKYIGLQLIVISELLNITTEHWCSNDFYMH